MKWELKVFGQCNKRNLDAIQCSKNGHGNVHGRGDVFDGYFPVCRFLTVVDEDRFPMLRARTQHILRGGYVSETAFSAKKPLCLTYTNNLRFLRGKFFFGPKSSAFGLKSKTKN